MREPETTTKGACVYVLYPPTNPRAVCPTGTTYRRRTPKVGRNEPCQCGCGRKAKRCNGTTA